MTTQELNPTQDEAETRRSFLKDAAVVAGVGAVSLTILPTLARAAEGAPAAAKPAAGAATPAKKKKFGFLVDTTKCIGCGKCMLACAAENNVPAGKFRTWVERYVHDKEGHVSVDMVHEAHFSFAAKPALEDKSVNQAYFVPKLCNHCDNTPCIQVCPVGASYKTDEGVVLIDHKRCIGCSYCVAACPFGTRFINPNTHSADKCTWCHHRTAQGLTTACAEVCPTGARLFGNTADPESEISKRIASERTDVLKSYLGTRPNTRYVGLNSETI